MKTKYILNFKRKTSITDWFNSSKYITIFAAVVVQILFGPQLSLAQQLNISIVQTGTSANSCTRTLTAQVQSGSGNYNYSWSISTPGIPFPGPNNVKTIHVGLNETTDFSVFVNDNSTGYTGSDSEAVQRILLGDFDIFLPNVFTPNGDGYNDTWMVLDENNGYGYINAFYYSLTVRNLSNNILYQTSATISAGHLGLLGGNISWNGRINGNGNLVSIGTYKYTLNLQNCTKTSTFNGNIDVLY